MSSHEPSRPPVPEASASPNGKGQNATPRRPRGCLGSAVSGGFGCLAFLIGSALAIALFAPQLLAGRVAGVVESHLGAKINGTVEIYDLDLSWAGRQKARRVVISSEAGHRVAEGALRLPSLIDLFMEARAEWVFRASDVVLSARVEEDGSSDLGQVFGIDEETGETELQALMRVIADAAKSSEFGKEQRSIKVSVSLREANFVRSGADPLLDRREATIRGADVTMTSSRVGGLIEVEQAMILGHGMEAPAKVSGQMRFGREADGTATLQGAELRAEPIPLESLRLLGFTTRAPKLGPLGPAQRAVAAYLEAGASIDLRFGEPAAGEATLRKLVVSLDGERGSILLRAVQDGDQLVAAPADGEPDALTADLSLDYAALGAYLREAIPSAVSVVNVGDTARGVVRSRDLRWTLPKGLLSAGTLFGGGAEWTARELSRQLEGAVTLVSPSAERAAIRFSTTDPARQTEYDRLSLTHRLTTVTFLGGMGSKLSSLWRSVGSGQRLGPFCKVDVSVPGVQLTPQDSLEPLLDLQLPVVPQSLVNALAPLPDDLRRLLPYRFTRIEIGGLPISRFGAVRPPTTVPLSAAQAAAQRGAARPVRMQIVTDGTDTIEGVYRAGLFTVRQAQVSLPLDVAACETIFERYMPWFVEVRPSDERTATLGISMTDLVFALEPGDFRQSGQVLLTSSPLKVRLHPDIAKQITVTSEDDEEAGWISWTPAPTRLRLQEHEVRYDRVELPLSDEYAAEFSGSLDRDDLTYDISGVVEVQQIGDVEAENLPRGVAIKGSMGSKESPATVYLEPGFAIPDLKDFLERAKALTDR